MLLNVKYFPAENLKYLTSSNVKCFLPKTCKLVLLSQRDICDGKYVIIRFGGEYGKMMENIKQNS